MKGLYAKLFSVSLLHGGALVKHPKPEAGCRAQLTALLLLEGRVLWAAECPPLPGSSAGCRVAPDFALCFLRSCFPRALSSHSSSLPCPPAAAHKAPLVSAGHGGCRFPPPPPPPAVRHSRGAGAMVPPGETSLGAAASSFCNS